MIKIYPDNYVKKQLILNSSNINTEIVFTLLEKNLEIVYGEMHTKISKKSVNKVIINEFKENNCIKIFLILEKNINMEYICFFSEFKTEELKDFFSEFKINEK